MQSKTNDHLPRQARDKTCTNSCSTDAACFSRRAIPELGNAQDTSYLCVIDAEGNCFSATPSDGVSGGPMIPGFGARASYAYV
eukprot:COSAG06_NODE_12016_length_1435_cov_1.193862_1_plen_83_part_00